MYDIDEASKNCLKFWQYKNLYFLGENINPSEDPCVIDKSLLPGQNLIQIFTLKKRFTYPT